MGSKAALTSSSSEWALFVAQSTDGFRALLRNAKFEFIKKKYQVGDGKRIQCKVRSLKGRVVARMGSIELNGISLDAAL